MPSPITTHVLDAARGIPAEGISIALEELLADGSWLTIGSGPSSSDGRQKDLCPEGFNLRSGTYRITFDAGAYFAKFKQDSFYGLVPIVFKVSETTRHYHVPLLLSPFGYSTYRGS